MIFHCFQEHCTPFVRYVNAELKASPLCM